MYQPARFGLAALLSGADLPGGLPGLKPPYPGRVIGALLSPSMNFSAINNREEGAGVLPTEVEDEFRVEDEFPALLNVFSRSATAVNDRTHTRFTKLRSRSLV